jgi:hypothetical protein
MTRVTPREEPGAGKPHARICEGESRMAELLDRYPAGTSTVLRVKAIATASTVEPLV